MKKYTCHLSVAAVVILLLFSCTSTDKPKEEQSVVQTVETVMPEQPAEARPVEQEDEFTRSTSALGEGTSVTKDVFQEDKKEIMYIIEQLSDAMKTLDYGKWRSYIDPDSAAYWSDPRKLKKAADRLPIKGLSLESLQDYFKFVFIPSRAGRKVDEILIFQTHRSKRYRTTKEILSMIFYKKIINGWFSYHLWKVDFFPDLFYTTIYICR